MGKKTEIGAITLLVIATIFYFVTRKKSAGTTPPGTVILSGKVMGSYPMHAENPVSGASINLHNSGTQKSYSTKSDSQGNYSIAGIEPGFYQIDCYHSSYEIFTLFSQVSEDMVLDIHLTLKETALPLPPQCFLVSAVLAKSIDYFNESDLQGGKYVSIPYFRATIQIAIRNVSPNVGHLIFQGILSSPIDIGEIADGGGPYPGNQTRTGFSLIKRPYVGPTTYDLDLGIGIDGTQYQGMPKEFYVEQDRKSFPGIFSVSS